MTRMYLPKAMNTTQYAVSAPTAESGLEWSTVAPGWVDVDVYPLLKPHCWTEREYKLKRLTGELHGEA